jgi:hypothetical protein
VSLTMKLAILAAAAQAQDGSRKMAPHYMIVRDVEGDHVAISAVWAELHAAGLLVPAMADPPGYNNVTNHLNWYITSRGRAFLAHAGQAGTPEDAEGFMKLLRRDPDMDPFVEAAVAEALRAYGAGWPIAAIMCLFAGMEHTVKAVGEAAGIAVERKSVNDVFVALGNRMKKQAKTMPSAQAFLGSTFPMARKARNDAAHHADAPDLATVRLLLCQFVSWYEAAAYLRDNPVV